MPYENVSGTNLGYYLINHDENGAERQETINGAAQFLIDAVMQKLRKDSATDIFIMSHGWKGDVPAARDQYERWIRAMAMNSADLEKMHAKRPGFSPLIIGLHWPSQPWGDEEFGNAGNVSFGVGVVNAPAPAAAADNLDTLIDRYACRIADTPRARAALKTIFDAALVDIAPARLPDEVRRAFDILDDEAALGSEGPAGAPGADREPFDAERSYQLARTDIASFGGSGSPGILDLLRQLSFWKMKERALHFGENGARDLLVKIQQAAPNAHVHLMGHSFGCIVVSAMLAGASAPVRPVSSLVLMQGALSLWSYCRDIPVAQGKPGYFHAIVDKQRVSGPIVATQSRFDKALGKYYPLGAGLAGQIVYEAGALPRYAAVGTYGIAGMDDPVHGLDMLSAAAGYEFHPGKIYNLESSAFICDGDGPSGAHSDIAKAEAAHVVWEAARG